MYCPFGFLWVPLCPLWVSLGSPWANLWLPLAPCGEPWASMGHLVGSLTKFGVSAVSKWARRKNVISWLQVALAIDPLLGPCY